MSIKNCIGIILILIGILLGLYCGVIWAFFGGIFQIVYALRAEVLQEEQIVFGVLRILFSGLIGYISCAVFVYTGLNLLD